MWYYIVSKQSYIQFTLSRSLIINQKRDKEMNIMANHV